MAVKRQGMRQIHSKFNVVPSKDLFGDIRPFTLSLYLISLEQYIVLVGGIGSKQLQVAKVEGGRKL